MKKILFGFVMLMVLYLSGLDESKTIGDSDFSAIQTACAGGDDLISHYYEKLLDQAALSREDWDEEFGDRDDHGTGSYVIKAMVGAIAELQSEQEIENNLSDSYNFLLNPTSPEDYLSIPDVIAHAENGNVMDAFYTLYNLAFIVDMLWWYEDGAINENYDWDRYHIELSNKLNELAGCACLS